VGHAILAMETTELPAVFVMQANTPTERQRARTVQPTVTPVLLPLTALHVQETT